MAKRLMLIALFAVAILLIPLQSKAQGCPAGMTQAKCFQQSVHQMNQAGEGTYLAACEASGGGGAFSPGETECELDWYIFGRETECNLECEFFTPDSFETGTAMEWDPYDEYVHALLGGGNEPWSMF